MNGYRVILVVLLVFAGTLLGVPAEAERTPDSLYKKAEKAYLNRNNERAIKLLKEAILRRPDHYKSRSLLNNLGVEPPLPDTAPPAEKYRKEQQKKDRKKLKVKQKTTGQKSASASTGEIKFKKSKSSTSQGTSPATMPQLREADQTDTTAGVKMPAPTVNRGSEGNQAKSKKKKKPNINRQPREKIRQLFGKTFVRDISEEIQSGGYFLGWGDFQSRLQVSDARMGILRKHFRMKIPVLNINRSSPQQLSRIPYMSRSLAEKIVNFRFTYGYFRSMDELMDVPGIKESNFDRLTPYLKL
ncbi:MAG: helix-hairpin-helix domain-containing protein [bacterium]